MDIKKIKAGNHVPESINVIIEIPLCHQHVKYEIDKESGALIVDRILKTPMFYPCNYGFMPNSLSEDGDPLDVLVITHHALIVKSVISVRPVGVLIMEDEAGKDEKILAVADDKIDNSYSSIRDIGDVSTEIKESIQHFFTHYKDLDNNKWVKIDGFAGCNQAKNIIISSLERFKKFKV